MNHYVQVDHQAQKLGHLLGFLKELSGQRIIIFFATCASVDYHHLALKTLLESENNSKQVWKLHGKINQKKRTKIYQEFKSEDKQEGQLGFNNLLITTDLAARGIDIPDVDWIIQFDPPQWSDQFIHRIGRTARAGRSGSSLILLTAAEEPYVAYLQNKHVEITELPTQYTPLEIKNKIQDAMMLDRELIDRSSDAFVSFLRYYKEHQLQFIFNMTQLDIG